MPAEEVGCQLLRAGIRVDDSWQVPDSRTTKRCRHCEPRQWTTCEAAAAGPSAISRGTSRTLSENRGNVTVRGEVVEGFGADQTHGEDQLTTPGLGCIEDGFVMGDPIAELA